MKSKAINLSEFKIRQAEYIDEYDPDEDISEEFSIEELEELGAASCPKPTKVIDTEGYYKEWS